MTKRHDFARQRTTFIGRKQEVGQLTNLLLDRACRLLTLIGPGGSGKTRLAIEVARKTTSSSHLRSFFVPLQPVEDGDGIISAIVDILPAQASDDSDSKQQVLDYLGNHHLILILDNFEHLLSETDLIGEFLDSAPEVKLLVTSRQILNLEGEWVRQVTGLSYPSHESDVDPRNYSAIQLFDDRARRVRGDFDITDELAQVVRICQLVDGMPLAIELAASWVSALSCDRIAYELARNLDLLANDQRSIPERHRSMRAMFNQSWKLLSSSEREVVPRLTVFRGSFDFEAAQHIADASPAMLRALVEKSLLHMDTAGRYHLHEVVRQYAAEQLNSPKAHAAAHAAHSRYFITFMKQREYDMKGRRQQAALDEIERNFENVRAAWIWAVEQLDTAAIDQAIESLRIFCRYRSRFRSGETLIGQACDQFASAKGAEAQRTWGRLVSSFVLIEQAKVDMENLREQIEQYATTARRSGDRRLLAENLAALSRLGIQNGDWSRAIDHAQESLALYHDIGDEYDVAWMLFWTATSQTMVGQRERGYANLRDGLNLARRLGDRVLLVDYLNGLAALTLSTGDYAQTRNYNREIIAFASETRNWQRVAWGRVTTALVDMLHGAFAVARQQLDEGLRIATEVYALEAHGYALAVLGILDCIQGNEQLGKQHCEQSRRISTGPSPTLGVHWGLCMAACADEDFERAARHSRAMMRTMATMDSPAIVAWALPMVALILVRKGEPSRAAEHLSLAYNHPTSVTEWFGHWSPTSQLRFELEATLGAEAFARAWQRGVEQDIGAVAIRWLTQDVQSTRYDEANSALPEPLTERELEVLTCIDAGMSNREIAQHMVIALSTVKRHISNVYAKLGVSSRTQAIYQARQHRLL